MISTALKCPCGAGFQHIEPESCHANFAGMPGTIAFSFEFFQRTA